MKTFAVILDYCGGSRTDRLFERMSADNPGYTIHLLDNASPRDRSRYATHRNDANSYIGGGIKDCIALAERHGSTYLFFLANDVKLINGIAIADFERLMDQDDDVVQISAGFSSGSERMGVFPHMISRDEGVRTVPHADLLACLLRLSFIKELGELPDSKGGWGYDLELAYGAHRLGKKICVADKYRCEHVNAVRTLYLESGVTVDKLDEMQAVYRKKFADEYDDFASFHRSFARWDS